MRKKNTTEESDNFKSILQEYKLELKLVYEKSQDAFEKQLSYLSAGALGLSILYIEDVIKDIKTSELKWALIASWIFLTLTLIVNLLSHYLSSRNTFKSIKEIDDGDYNAKKVNIRIDQVNVINKSTIVTFIIGILLLITFVINNTMNQKINNTKPDLQKGVVPTSAPQNPKPQTGQNPTSAPTQPVKPTPSK